MTPEERYNQRRKFFLDSIGKRLWRPNTQCACNTCKDVYLNGIEVMDREHAIYLHDMELAYRIDQHMDWGKGVPWRYFSTQEELRNYEAEINKLEI